MKTDLTSQNEDKSSTNYVVFSMSFATKSFAPLRSRPAFFQSLLLLLKPFLIQKLFFLSFTYFSKSNSS